MKRLTLLFTLIFLTTNLLNAQWEWQNPLPQGNNLTDVYLIDSMIGWVAGNAGTVLKTNDGGQTYTLLETNTNVDLNAIRFYDSYKGFVVGREGTILLSNNGGKLWSSVNSEVSSDLNDLFLFYPEEVWVVGDQGTLLHSYNGGNSWESLFSDTTINLNSIYFIDESKGWVAGVNSLGEGIVYSTLNGGETWSLKTSNYLSSIKVIQYSNDSNGWALADNNIYKTIDGGSTWELNFSTDPSKIIKDFFFVDSLHGWAVGWYLWAGGPAPANVYKTIDGGETWSLCEFNEIIKRGLYSVYFSDTIHGCSVGPSGNIVRRQQNSLDWEVICGTYSRPTLFDIFIVDTENAWIIGNDIYGPTILQHSIDGCLTWISQEPPSEDLTKIFFIDQNVGWTVTRADHTFPPYDIEIFKTINSGENWEMQYQTESWHEFKDIYFVNSLTGWAVGGSFIVSPPQGGIFVNTTDGGETWNDISEITDMSLSSITFADENYGWIAGHEIILHTTNAGQTWDEQWSGVHSLKDICFVDQLHGWAIGDSIYSHGSLVMKTTNGGISWEKQFFDYEFNELFFIDQHTGYIVTNSGHILFTSDGGNSWQEQISRTSNKLEGIYFINHNEGWVVGSNGTILHTENGGIVDVENFSLAEAGQISASSYPNPFTISTTISYNLQQPTTIQISIFNHLGQQVDCIQQNQSQGKQQVSWDASGQPPGMFYFQMQAGEQVATGKLLLVR